MEQNTYWIDAFDFYISIAFSYFFRISRNHNDDDDDDDDDDNDDDDDDDDNDDDDTFIKVSKL